jgi:hypothetical protein
MANSVKQIAFSLFRFFAFSPCPFGLMNGDGGHDGPFLRPSDQRAIFPVLPAFSMIGTLGYNMAYCGDWKN